MNNFSSEHPLDIEYGRILKNLETVELNTELRARGFQSYADDSGRIRLWLRNNKNTCSSSTQDFDESL
ncbi:MAG: hypothetical protein KDK41_11705 [Leptospiraceae bacterium]|nr:hypothetical protein [Leptospiraceae bacterium]